LELRQVDERVAYVDQLQEQSGPVVLINEFSSRPKTSSVSARCGLKTSF